MEKEMMKIKELFTVPAGEHVSEMCLHRVLVASISCILLCMSCLAGTTWAWFNVSIDNGMNIIEIGKPSGNVQITAPDGQTNTEPVSGTEWPIGNYQISLNHDSQPDQLNHKNDMYVTFTVYHGTDVSFSFCVALNSENQYTQTVKIAAEDAFKLCWEPSWFPPDGAALLNEDPVTISAPQTLEPVEGEEVSDIITEEPEPSEENPDPADGEEIPDAPDDEPESELSDENSDPADGEETPDAPDDEQEAEPSDEDSDPADGEEIPVASDAVTEEETPDEDAEPSEEEPEEGSDEEIE